MHHMESRATGPQKFVVGLASVLALVVALVFCATYANLSISAPEVEGAVMPPGMIMTYDSPAEAMRDMAAVDPRAVSYAAPADAKGDQPLEAHIENGVKVFDLETSVIKRKLLGKRLWIERCLSGIAHGHSLLSQAVIARCSLP
jgi:hypothetical protein